MTLIHKFMNNIDLSKDFLNEENSLTDKILDEHYKNVDDTGYLRALVNREQGVQISCVASYDLFCMSMGVLLLSMANEFNTTLPHIVADVLKVAANEDRPEKECFGYEEDTTSDNLA